MPESIGLHAGHMAVGDCKTCDWRVVWKIDQPNVDLESEAHMHVQTTGHTVNVRRTMITTYSPITNI